MFDSIEDLVRSDRLREHGGKQMFEHLARLFILHTNDHHNVHIVAAGSSAFLKEAYAHTVADPGKFRWSVHEMPKPSADAVKESLLAAGYENETAAEIISVCGTRLRLLSRFLSVGASERINVRETLREYESEADTCLRKLVAEASQHGLDEYNLMCGLRQIADGCSQLEPLRPGSFFPRNMDNAEALSRVLYLNRENCFQFQNRPIERAFHRLPLARQPSVIYKRLSRLWPMGGR